MPKSLKEILAGVKERKTVPGSTGKSPGVDYMPKPGDEQEFVAKHEVEKHEDRVGNGDDIYNATNIKYSLEKDEKHGHKSPKDKKVYDKKLKEEKHIFHVHLPLPDIRPHKTVDTDASEPVGAKPKAARLKITVPGDRRTATNKAARYVAINYGTNVKFTHAGKVEEESKLSCNMTEEGTFCPIHETSSCMGTEARTGSKKQLREIAKKKMSERINYTSGTMRNPVPAVTMDPGLGRS